MSSPYITSVELAALWKLLALNMSFVLKGSLDSTVENTKDSWDHSDTWDNSVVANVSMYQWEYILLNWRIILRSK